MRRAALLVILVAAASVLSFRSIYDPDLHWHLAQGREYVLDGLVRTNVFSSEYREYRQHYTSWLFEWGAYRAWSLAGDTGIQALQAGLLAAAFAIVYLACRVRGALLPSLAILILGFLVVEPRAMPRPYLASFAGMAACAWFVERSIASRSVRPLWWTVPLVAVWSNVHAECVFGVLMIALYALADVVRPSALTRRDALRAVLIAACSAAALIANPYGLGLMLYMYENVSVPQILSIAELQRPDPAMYRAFYAYLAVTIALYASLPKALTVWEVLITVAFGVLGLGYARLTPLIFLATAPMLSIRLTALAARGFDGRAMLVTSLAAAVFVSRAPVTSLIANLDADALHPPAFFSSRAMQFVSDEGLTGLLFNSNNLGGWLAWERYPTLYVFQDSRLQAYPPGHFQRILQASRSQPAWDALVEGRDWALLSSSRPNALSGAGMFPRHTWATVFWDEAVEILVRRTGRFAALARAREYVVLVPDAEVVELVKRLPGPDGERIRDEARRNRSENPEGFLAAAVLCLSDERAACADVDRHAARSPAVQQDAAVIKLLRDGR